MSKEVTDHDGRIGARIRAARLQGKLSQTDLGDHLGVTFQQIQKYERGSNRVSAARLTEIASYFKKPVTWFLDEGSPTKVVGGRDVFTEFMSVKSSGDLAKAFFELNAYDRAVVLQVAQALHNHSTATANVRNRVPIADSKGVRGLIKGLGAPRHQRAPH